MKNIKLFEDFSNPRDLDMMIAKLGSDPEFSDYEMTLDTTGSLPFLVWLNPGESRRWMDSGYSEDYDGDFSSVKPMAVLAFTEIFGEPFAYLLTPEEKDSMRVMMTPELDPDQFVMLDSLDALKGAIEGSLWGMS